MVLARYILAQANFSDWICLCRQTSEPSERDLSSGKVGGSWEARDPLLMLYERGRKYTDIANFVWRQRGNSHGTLYQLPLLKKEKRPEPLNHSIHRYTLQGTRPRLSAA
jgi:hypothetical protein